MTASGPNDVELARIEADWPDTQAELALVDAECRCAADPTDELAALALTRAAAHLQAVVAHHNASRRIGA